MNQTKFFITTVAITLVLGFTLIAVPLGAATKGEIKQEKAAKGIKYHMDDDLN